MPFRRSSLRADFEVRLSTGGARQNALTAKDAKDAKNGREGREENQRRNIREFPVWKASNKKSAIRFLLMFA